MTPAVQLVPLSELDAAAWRRVQQHFRDPEISHLNGTPPSRMPLWLLRPILRADSRRNDRHTFGITDEAGEFIGLTELYDLEGATATLGIIIGERSHWGRGYGPAAIDALLAYGFTELKLERIRLSTFLDNVRAQAAFRKCGFTEVRRTSGRSGRVSVWMGLSRERWEELRRPTPGEQPAGVVMPPPGPGSRSTP